MAAASRDARASGGGAIGAVRAGVTAGLLVALVAVGLLGYLQLSGKRLPFERPREISRVLVVVALPDESGDVVAQTVAMVDLSAGRVESVDPSMPVTIPGTSYSALRDAYPFGGGAGVAKALAQARGGEPLPYLVVGSDAMSDALAASQGLAIDLPEPMAVFDGERLYEWSAGPVRITSVSELRAILNGAAYLSASGRESVLQQVAEGVVSLAGRLPGGLAGAIEDGVVESDLVGDEVHSVEGRLGSSQ